MRRKVVFAEARKAFHSRLVQDGILCFDKEGVASNADKSNAFSCEIAEGIAHALNAGRLRAKKNGQKAGAGFEEAVAKFVETTFPKLQNLRPGTWSVARLGNKSRVKTADFAQYEHLFALAEAVRENPKLQAALGNDYLVSPDVVVARALCEIASLALGTGDIDCVYHFALYELLAAAEKCSSKSRDEAMVLLNNMIDGKRLKDISDLPLDLAC